MAAACLREDRWLIHHLASDLPVAEIARLASHVGAGLVVLSSAQSNTARQARQAARAITATRPALNVLTGQPGDSLHDLLAHAGHPPGLPQGPRT
jgi:hypothetical protein